jgi:hypothetical protein
MHRGHVLYSQRVLILHAEASPGSAPLHGTWSKEPMSRPASTGCMSREKGEGSTRRKKRVSPVRATEDAQIPCGNTDSNFFLL